MEKRTIIAFGLVAAIWIIWLLVFPSSDHSNRQPGKQQQKQSVQKKDDVKQGPQAQISISDVQNTREEKSIGVSTNKYRVELSTVGASVKHLVFKEGNIELVVDKAPFTTSKVLDFAIHFNDTEFLENNDLSKSNWAYNRDQGGAIRFYTNIFIDDNPIRIEKIYRFTDNAYYFSVEYKITNTGSQDISFQNNSVIISPGDMIGPSIDFRNTYNKLASIFYLNDDFERGSRGGGFFSSDDPSGHERGNVSWFGIMSRYFLIIMIPEGFTGSGVIFDRREDHGYRTGMYLGMNALRAGTDVSRSFRVYVGDKNKERLVAIAQNLADAADVSKWIEPIRNFVLWCLLSINRYVGNIGWSLVIFSILTKVAFTPLTMKSMDSMKRMQQLTPKLNQLKAKYKDKPDVMQREMMKLYKENKVNPLGGCLPMLLQMPFFFALYSALINSIDLWNASFVLWINDLSMPDTVATIAGFNLNILPLVMTVTSFAQQKMSTVETGPQQKMMMMMMPVVLLFIFWSMPSGLVLYWSLQNIFQIGHQLIINKFGSKKV